MIRQLAPSSPQPRPSLGGCMLRPGCLGCSCAVLRGRGWAGAACSLSQGGRGEDGCIQSVRLFSGLHTPGTHTLLPSILQAVAQYVCVVCVLCALRHAHALKQHHHLLCVCSAHLYLPPPLLLQSNIISEGFRSLREGETVEYDTETSPDGRTKAINVTGPGGAPPQVCACV